MRYSLLPLLAFLLFASACRAQEPDKNADPKSPAPKTADPENFDTQVGRLTSPEAALKAMRVPDGFRTTLFAAEPEVRQPIALATDTRGRVWVAENYTYAQREVNFDDRLRDRIVILEDTDHDGVHDRRTVFWESAKKLTSVELGFGGVWALCAPQLLFIPDRDHDDRPDGPPIVVLDGWDADRVRHNIVNGLRWGPDGWLYGRHGILATSLVGAPGTPTEDRTPINCGIWRYHPTCKNFEVVATGTTNPWGMDWDAHGQMFFINTVIGHLWHVVPGAHYERMYGEDFNPHLYTLLPQAADHVHWNTDEAWNDIRKGVTQETDQAGGGHAHSGLMIYQGDNWPASYRNDLFTINLHGRRLNRDAIRPQGSTYRAQHREDFAHSDDLWFRGIDLVLGNDGGVFVADWSDIGECHENDGVHRSSGRLFKITHGQPDRPAVADVRSLSSPQLVALLRHDNAWYARKAQRVLQERHAAGDELSEARAALESLLGSEDAPLVHRLRACWSLHAIEALAEDRLLALLGNREEHLRIWAVKLLCEQEESSSPARQQLHQLAAEEDAAAVLVQLASLLGRLPLSERWPLAEALSKRKKFADDAWLSTMIWYGVEPAVGADPGAAMKLLDACQVPALRTFVARRVAGTLASRPEAVEQLVQRIGRAPEQAQEDLLSGMTAALAGWRKAPAPASWEQVAARLAKSSRPAIREAAQELSVIFGDGLATADLRKLAADNGAPLDTRRNAIRSLVTARDPAVVPLLQKLLGDRELASDAVRGLAAFDNQDTPQRIIDRLGSMRVQARLEAINTLASRPAYARFLLQAVEAQKVPPDDVSAFQIRQMHSFGEADISKQLRRLWPQLRHTTADKSKKINEYREFLTADVLRDAEASQGRVIYQRSCATCHKLFGTGGSVGPDLTGGQRSNLTYLLENIVAPSSQLATNYRMSILHLEDGRVLNGVISQQTERTLTLQTPTGKLVIPQEDVAARRDSQLSMMPERLLDNLSPTQVRDLIGYLMSPRQVPLDRVPPAASR